LLPLPLTAGLAVLPVIGVALNGTSSCYTAPSGTRPAERRPGVQLVLHRGDWLRSVIPSVVRPRQRFGRFADHDALIAAVVLLTLRWLASSPALRYS